MNLFGYEIKRKREKEDKPQGAINLISPEVGKRSQSPAERFDGYLSAHDSFDIPIKIWQFIERASLFNADFSGAVGLLKTLADTPHTITGIDGAELSELANEKIKKLQKRLFPTAGDIDGLQLALIDQYIKYGAMATECEIAKDKTIKRVWLLPIKEIRFELRNGEFVAYQDAGGLSKKIELNPLTFEYTRAEEWMPGSPYGKPPFVGAFEALLRSEKMIDNIDFILEKIGLMGIYDVGFEVLPPVPGETYGDPSHIARNRAYAESLAKAEEGSKRKIVRVHPKTTEYKVSQVGSDARGVIDFWRANEELVSAGMMVSEALLGRARQTTEAFATVLYRMASNIAETAQRLTANHLESIYNLELLLNGLNESVQVEFEPPASLDPISEANAEKIRIETIGLKLMYGLIDSDTARAEAGYLKKKNNTRKSPLILTEGLRRLTEKPITALLDEFGIELQNIAQIAILRGLLEALEIMQTFTAGDFGTAEKFVKEIFRAVNKGWGKHAVDFERVWHKYSAPIMEQLTIYDKKAWGGKTPPVGFTMSEGALATASFSGRCGTHLCTTLWADVAKNPVLADYLKKEFLERPNDIFRRSSAEGFEKFRNSFKGELDHLTDWQIRRIQDTEVMRMRNSAHLEQLYQADVKQARITETANPCIICQPLEGLLIDVENQYQAMQSQYALKEEDYLEHLKSASQTIKEAGEITKSIERGEISKTDAKAQTEKLWETMRGEGIQLPPFHPACQHDIVIV